MERDSIEGIVLDAVGTLIEPRPSVSETYCGAARRQGVELDVSVIKRRFLENFATDEQRGPLATDEATERRRWRRVVAACLPEVPDTDRAFDELWDHFASPASWVVFPDVARSVARLRALGLRICVASNFDSRLRRVASGHAELRDWIEPLVISSEVGFRKPHAAFYDAACRGLGLSPDRVLCIGDDAENDGRGPIRAGLRAHLVVRSGDGPNDLTWSPSLDHFADEWERGWTSTPPRADKD